MSEWLTKVTGDIVGYLWSMPMIYLALFVGLMYSLWMKVPQIRLFKDMTKYLFKSQTTSEQGISSFQGFAMALGGRIGVGNIAGVATAIFWGGPGSIFWMWVIAFIGAGTAFAESALAQLYKREIDGEYRGGPAYYIEKGTGIAAFGIIFAITGVIANGFTGPTIQAFNIAESAHNAFGIEQWIVGVVVAVLFVAVVFGGMKRIGKVAEYIVPIMSIIYIVLAIVIMSVNYSRIPEMFSLIFKGAFKMDAMYGAIWGQTIIWGVKRGIYSNEAGMGSGAHAAASAEVSHPAKQGLAQSFSVYVDTLFVCTATAIMILSTDMYNVADSVADPEGGVLITDHLGATVAAGTGYTQRAIDTLIPGFGSAFIAIAIFFFAFTTLLSFAFYTDANVNYMVGGIKDEKARKMTINVIRVILTGIIIFGSMRESSAAWNLADIGVGLMCWVNLIALIFLAKKTVALMKDYERQKKLGVDPVFEPADIGVTNAPLWDKIAKEKYPELLAAKHKAEGK